MAYRTHRVVVVIPARGGSKGVPRKNLRQINGQTLVERAVRASLSSGTADQVYVSTEDDEIAAVAQRCGAQIVLRPPSLAGDAVPTQDVLLHAAKFLSADILCLVQCTAPLMGGADLDGTVSRLVETGADVAIACTPSDAMSFQELDSGELRPIEWDVLAPPTRRQDRQVIWDVEGSVWATWLRDFVARGRFHSQRMVAHHVARRRLDIDSEEDLAWAQAILGAEKRLTEYGGGVYYPS